ncbi:MAG: hypothetical protein GF398_01980 [Chitinivibrionales bacterium]|nr:hypothetical protein [Chitinivibrionales bacterium]
MISFSEYLKRLPHNLVFQQLLEKSMLERKIISSSMLTDIAEEFSSPASLHTRFDALSLDGRFACSLAYLFGARGLPHGDTTRVYEELRQSFLTYRAHDSDGNSYSIGFREAAEKLLDKNAHILAQFLQSESSAEVASPLQHRSLNDLLVVIALASQRQIRRNKDGRLHLSTQAALQKLLHGFNSPWDGDIDTVADLHFTYGIERNLFNFRDGYCTPNESVVANWLSQSVEMCLKDFVDFSCPNWFDLRLLMAALDLRENTVFTTALLKGKASLPMLYDILKVLNYLGILNIRHDKEGTIAFSRAPESAALSISPATTATSGIIIMPDFTALLPQEVPPRDLYWFARIGTLDLFDQVYKGKIDKKVVADTMATAIPPETILQYLHAWHAPTNVVETVREWIREFSRLSICSDSVLICSDESISSQISGIHAINKYIEPLEASKIFKIRKGFEIEVECVLSELGFDPRLPRRPKARPRNASWNLQHVGPAREPCYQFDQPDREPANATIKTGKYSEELKARDVTEMCNIIDYALLMGSHLRFEYAGSPGVKKDVYTIVPTLLIKKDEMQLEGVSVRANATRKFYLTKIEKIGVLSP